MASRIQGITVEIGGDTTKLSKVNKEIRDTQSQLKDVNKLLKLDPGNMDLMAQMQASSMDSIRQMVSGIQEMFAGMQENDNMGTICIPVYIGGTLLDEVVVNAQARQNLRSGER